VTDEAIALLAPRIGTRAACRATGVAQATWHRRRRLSPPPARPEPVPHRDRAQPWALAAAERAAILDALHSPRFADLAPDEAWATLLDEGTYLGSASTYYRVLREPGESRERRRQATHPAKVKPELAATGPNQVYSWDITKLRGPAKWAYFHLYVILDIYSRYAVGWMVASREPAALAEKLIAETCAKQGIAPGQLSLHADRGSSMTSKPVALLGFATFVTWKYYDERYEEFESNYILNKKARRLKEEEPNRRDLRPVPGARFPKNGFPILIFKTYCWSTRRS
jgi:putative transposase